MLYLPEPLQEILPGVSFSWRDDRHGLQGSRGLSKTEKWSETDRKKKQVEKTQLVRKGTSLEQKNGTTSSKNDGVGPFGGKSMFVQDEIDERTSPNTPELHKMTCRKSKEKKKYTKGKNENRKQTTDPHRMKTGQTRDTPVYVL